VPVRDPVAPGVKVMEIVQLPPAASVAGLTGQLFVGEKSDKLLETLAMVTAEERPFFTVTVLAVLVVPSG